MVLSQYREDKHAKRFIVPILNPQNTYLGEHFLTNIIMLYSAKILTENSQRQP